jgi:C-methyltransferase-like protein/putative zinc binding protein
MGCFVCRNGELTRLVDVGPQPVSNRFLRAPTDDEELFPVALRQCDACGLVQIEQPVPASALVPPYDWVTYSEPEGHLDELVDILLGLPGVGPGCVAAGVSFKDDSTLARLERRGLETWRIDFKDDLGIGRAHAGHGVETIQNGLTPSIAEQIAGRRGRAGVLLVRHILEHAAVPLEFMAAMKTLVQPDGYIVIEVPDCSRALDACDYTTIWEEHTLYYTPETFRHSLQLGALDVVRAENYPYPFENSLVAIARVNGRGAAPGLAATIRHERGRGLAFARGFNDTRVKVRRLLDEHRRGGGRIALFGAGHLACTWINVFGVGDCIDCVVDDNPHKRGLYMPGSKLPIVGSTALVERNITLCLLSLNPIGEQKVVEKNRTFVEQGGAFASIFPASALALMS